ATALTHMPARARGDCRRHPRWTGRYRGRPRRLARASCTQTPEITEAHPMNSRNCYSHLPTPVMPRVPPQKLLLGQKALVTGASSGIGRAIALALGDAGADVVVNYVSDEDKAQALADEIRSKGVRACTLRADVADESQVRSMFSAMLEEFGTVDILVNNAGL